MHLATAYGHMVVRSLFFLIYSLYRSIITIDNGVTVKFRDKCEARCLLFKMILFKFISFLRESLPEAPTTDDR